MESASRTVNPSSRKIRATSLLPLAIPPVRPSRSMAISARVGRGRNAGGMSRAPSQSRSFHGVAHEHGDRHGADATWNGRERAGNIDGVRVHIADQNRMLFAKFLQARGKITKQ